MGVKWDKYSLPIKLLLDPFIVEGDRIYSGSYKEFGMKEGK
jgi:hypothetical protein